MRTPEERAEAAEYMRQWRAAHPPSPERRDEINASQRARYKPRSPEQHRRGLELQKTRRRANPEKQRANARAYHERHPEVRKAQAAKFKAENPNYWQEWGLARRREMVDAYGGHCACCGETELVFLTLDHINGGGSRERRLLGANGLFRRLREAGWPTDGYRLLCMNCQFGTRFGKTCPHQTPTPS